MYLKVIIEIIDSQTSRLTRPNSGDRSIRQSRCEEFARQKPGVGSHCPTRIGILLALDSRHRGAQDEKRPCAHEEHERGGYRM